MPWQGIILGAALLITGLIPVIYRKASADLYALRCQVLPPDHRQYWAQPAFTPTVTGALGCVCIAAGLIVLGTELLQLSVGPETGSPRG